MKNEQDEIFRFQWWVDFDAKRYVGQQCFSCKGLIGHKGVQDLAYKDRDYCLKCAKLFGIWE